MTFMNSFQYLFAFIPFIATLFHNAKTQDQWEQFLDGEYVEKCY